MRTLKYCAFLACLFGLATLNVAQGVAQDVGTLAGQVEAGEMPARIAACQQLAALGIKAQAAVPQLMAALKSDNADLQRNAALALAEVGSHAAAAVPVLIEALGDSDAVVRAAAAHALGEIGPAARDATEKLIGAIADEDPAVRREVRSALHDIAPPREVALPLWIKMLETASPADAAAAVASLAEAGEASVPALVEALNHKDAAYWACLALSEIGAPAAAAVPKLTELLDSEEMEVRLQATIALAHIGPAAKSAEAKIIEHLHSDKLAGVRYASAYALGSIGDKAIAIPELGKEFDSEDEFLRVSAAWGYVRLIDKDKAPLLAKAAKIIVDAMASDDHRVRDLAARALADPDIPRETLGPAFRRVLQGVQDPQKLMEIVDALATLGPRAVPLCVRSLEEKGPLRFYALQLVIKVGPDAAPAVPAIIATLADPQPELRRESLFALGAIGPAAAKATDKIAAALTDEDTEVRHAACYALGKIGADAKAALPALQKAMASDDAFLQMAAVWAALKISPADHELRVKAVPYLIKAVTDERVHVRLEAVNMLGELGADAKKSLSALQGALEDESEDVQAAAAVALEAISK
jgi:HEAT repeat protein